MEKRKSHKLLTFLSPFLAIGYVIAANLADGAIAEKIPGALGFFTAFMVSAILLFLLMLGFILLDRRLELNSGIGVRLTKGDCRNLLLAVILVPLVVIVEQNVHYLVCTYLRGVSFSAYDYTAAELREDLAYSLHAIFIAPTLEELGFRIIPISLCQKKSSKIAMFIFTTLLFGVCHGKSIWITMALGAIYGLALLWTGRPVISVAMHIVSNAFVTILGMLSYLGYATAWKNKAYPVAILFKFPVTIVICLLLIAVWIYVFGASKSWKDSELNEEKISLEKEN